MLKVVWTLAENASDLGVKLDCVNSIVLASSCPLHGAEGNTHAVLHRQNLQFEATEFMQNLLTQEVLLELCAASLGGWAAVSWSAPWPSFHTPHTCVHASSSTSRSPVTRAASGCRDEAEEAASTPRAGSAGRDCWLPSQLPPRLVRFRHGWSAVLRSVSTFSSKRIPLLK